MNAFVDRYYRIAWLVLGVAWAGLIYQLFKLWGTAPDYSDRYVILLGSGWLIHRNRERFFAAPESPARWPRIFLVLSMMALPPAWYVLSQMNVINIMFWWITGAVCTATLALSVDTWGVPRTRLLFFPVLFILFALPIPDPIYQPIRIQLQKLSTTLATLGFSLVGYEPIRKGFEIYLPSGPLEVVEACSGIRSMTALTAIAAFVAYMRGFGFVRGFLLLAGSVPVVIICNATRIFLTGFVQESIGTAYSQGTYHEILGGVMVLLGLVLIVGLSRLMAPRNTEAAEPQELEAVPEEPARRAFGGIVPCLIVVVGIGASGFLFWKGHNRITVREEEAPLDEFAMQLSDWKGVSVPIDEGVIEKLGCVKILHRNYSNHIGQAVDAWIMYWPASSLIKRGHHPEVCLPLRGFVAVGKEGLCIPWKSSSGIKLTEHLFRRDRSDQLLHYWTQDGPVFLDDAEELELQKLNTLDWLTKQFRDSTQKDRVPRLGVMIGTNVNGPIESGRRTLNSFSKSFATELYRVCPWAEPRE